MNFADRILLGIKRFNTTLPIFHQKFCCIKIMPGTFLRKVFSIVCLQAIPLHPPSLTLSAAPFSIVNRVPFLWKRKQTNTTKAAAAATPAGPGVHLPAMHIKHAKDTPWRHQDKVRKDRTRTSLKAKWKIINYSHLTPLLSLSSCVCGGHVVEAQYSRDNAHIHEQLECR